MMNNRSFLTCVAFAVVIAGFLAYSSRFRNDFVWDDASSILRHQHIQDPSKFTQLFKEDLHAFGRGQGNFYRPLLAASFMLDYALSRPAPGNDPDPLFFHLTNTLWHVAAALLLLALLSRCDAPRPVRAIVPMLYVAHPLHTQAVTYISGRGDPMAAALMFAALWFALWEGTTARRLLGTLFALLFFVAALLSKESAGIYPVLLLLLVFTAPSRATHETSTLGSKRGRALPAVLAIGVMVGYFLLRATVLRFSEESGSAPLPLGDRLVVALKALAVYTRLIVFPTGLHMERTLDGVPLGVAFAGGLILVSLIAGTLLAVQYRQYRVAAGLGWFLITWFPISGVIPLNAPIAEHWMYVPLAGLLWAITEGVWLVLQPQPTVARGAVGVAAFVVLMLFLVGTSRRNLAWRDNETLFRDTLSKNPRSARVHFNLAVTYEDILKNYPGARRHYEKVLELYEAKKRAGEFPADRFAMEELEANLSLGKIYLRQGDIQRAGKHFSTLLTIAPDNVSRAYVAEAAMGMGNVYLIMGDNENARKLFEQAARMNPNATQGAPSTADTTSGEQDSPASPQGNN